MAELFFSPAGQTVTVAPGIKILQAAVKNKIDIQYGCAACRCGTCAVRITKGATELEPMRPDELKLLGDMKLPTDGNIRLACQSRVSDTAQRIEIDLSFQLEYSPDHGIDS